jgi:hypothetical protein
MFLIIILCLKEFLFCKRKIHWLTSTVCLLLLPAVSRLWTGVIMGVEFADVRAKLRYCCWKEIRIDRILAMISWTQAFDSWKRIHWITVNNSKRCVEKHKDCVQISSNGCATAWDCWNFDSKSPKCTLKSIELNKILNNVLYHQNYFKAFYLFTLRLSK